MSSDNSHFRNLPVMSRGHPLAIYRSIDPESNGIPALSRLIVTYVHTSTRDPRELRTWPDPASHHLGGQLRTTQRFTSVARIRSRRRYRRGKTCSSRFSRLLARSRESHERGTKRFATVRGRCSTARMHTADSTCSGILVCPHHTTVGSGVDHLVSAVGSSAGWGAP